MYGNGSGSGSGAVPPSSSKKYDASVYGFCISVAIDIGAAGALLVAFWILARNTPELFRRQDHPEVNKGFSLSLTPGLHGVDDFQNATASMIVAFLRSLAILSVTATVFCLPLLLSLNLIDGQDLDGMNRLTAANIDQGSQRLVAHAIGLAAWSFVGLYLAYSLCERYVELRDQYRGKYKPEDQGIIVRSAGPPAEILPILNGVLRPHGEAVVPYQDTRQLSKVLQDCDTVRLELETCKDWARDKIRNPEAARPQHWMGGLVPRCCGQQVDSIEHWTKELQRLETEIDGLLVKEGEMPALGAWIVLTTGPRDDLMGRVNAALKGGVAGNMTSMLRGDLSSALLKGSRVEPAPQAGDIQWDALVEYPAYWRNTTCTCLILGVLIGFIPLTAVVSGLMSLSKLDAWCHCVSWTANFPALAGLLQTKLPIIITAVMFCLVPIVFTRIEAFRKTAVRSTDVHHVLGHYYEFLLFQMFCTIVGGTLLSEGEQLFDGDLDFQALLSSLATGMASNGNFYAAMCVSAALISLPLQRSRLVPWLMCKWHRRSARCQREFDAAAKPPPYPVQTELPKVLNVLSISLTYSCVNPIILPFMACFCVGNYALVKHEFIHLITFDVDHGANIFPTLFRCFMTAMVYAQVSNLIFFSVQKCLAATVVAAVMCGLTVIAWTWCTKKYGLSAALEQSLAVANAAGSLATNAASGVVSAAASVIGVKDESPDAEKSLLDSADARFSDSMDLEELVHHYQDPAIVKMHRHPNYCITTPDLGFHFPNRRPSE